MFRSALFGPGSRPDILAKMLRSSPDVIILDLEDAVAESAKAEARVTVARACADLHAIDESVPIHIRVNDPRSVWFEADVAALGPRVSAVVIPKINTPGEVAAVTQMLTSYGHDMPIVVGIETVRSVASVVDILQHDGVQGCYFGAEDYVADLGGVRTPSGWEVLVPRTQVAAAARLAGVYSLDQVVTDVTSDDRFTREAKFGRSIGFDGKLCIHPRQVPLANAAFMPTEDELVRARRLLDVYEDSLRNGQGATTFEGQMVDEPLARQAKALLRRS